LVVAWDIAAATTAASRASGAKDAHIWAPIVAAVIVAALVAAAVLAVSGTANRTTKAAEAAGPATSPVKPSRRGGLFHGYDRRWSTSKTQAALWTIVLAFMVVTEAILAISGHGVFSGSATTDFGHFMAHTLDAPANRGLYLVLLGGPYAAALFAKTTVTSKVNSGKLQKTDGSPNNLSDVVSNDAGAVDLYDLQYTLFNLIALAITVGAFLANEAGGLPDLPNLVAFLTGGSALTYSVNKGVTTNQPALTAVHPQSARVGDRVTVYGNNLTTVSTTDTLKAAVGGVDAAIQKPAAAVAGGSPVAGAEDEVAFTVPSPPSSAAWSPGDKQQVSVTTPAGLVASLNDALAVVPDEPVAVSLSPALIVVASAAEYADIPIEITGQYLGTPGATTADTATAQVSIRGPNTAATTTAAYVDYHHVSFTLPPDTPAPAGAPLTFQVQLIRGANSTEPVTLTVQAAPAPDLNAINPDLIVADPGTSLDGQQIALTGTNLLPPAQPAGAARNVAAQGADPLKAAVTDAAGASAGHVASQPQSANAAAVTLLAPLTIPQAGDSPVTIVLQRGSLSSGPQTLTLRARYDAAMTVPPIAAPAGTALAGHEVTVRSDVFSVNLPAGQPGPLGRHIAAGQATLLVQVDAGGVTLEVPDLPAVSDGQTDLKFTLPPGTPVMPPGGARWNITVSRDGHVIAVGDLVLQDQ
jgi:hypothetical protein